MGHLLRLFNLNFLLICFCILYNFLRFLLRIVLLSIRIVFHVVVHWNKWFDFNIFLLLDHFCFNIWIVFSNLFINRSPKKISFIIGTFILLFSELVLGILCDSGSWTCSLARTNFRRNFSTSIQDIFRRKHNFLWSMHFN